MAVNKIKTALGNISALQSAIEPSVRQNPVKLKRLSFLLKRLFVQPGAYRLKKVKGDPFETILFI